MSFDSAMNNFAKAARILNEVHKAAFSNAASVHTLSATLKAALTGNRLPVMTDAIEALRPNFEGLLTSAFVRAFLRPFAAAVVEEIDGDDLGFSRNMEQIRVHMNTNGKTVLSRTITVGSITNSKLSLLLVALKDKLGKVIDTGIVENWTFRCTTDSGGVKTGQSGGSRENQEVFRFEGDAKGIDAIEVRGTGRTENALGIIDERHQSNLLRNASWTDFNNAAPNPTQVPSAIDSWPNWEASNTTHFSASNAQTHRDRSGQTTQKSLSNLLSGSMFQRLTGPKAAKRITFREDRLYIPGLWVYLPAARTGNIVVSLGDKSYTVDLSTLADSTFVAITPNMSTDIENFYFPNFNLNTDEIRMKIETTTLSGAIFWDDAFLREASLIRGIPVTLIGGGTRHEIDDVFTTDISISAETVFQYWAVVRSRVFNLLGHTFTLPHSGAPTYTDVQ